MTYEFKFKPGDVVRQDYFFLQIVAIRIDKGSAAYMYRSLEEHAVRSGDVKSLEQHYTVVDR